MRLSEITKTNYQKLGLCLKNALSHIKANPKLRLYKGPPGRKGDSSHFWVVDKSGEIYDPSKEIDSQVVSNNYSYKGVRVDPDSILDELGISWDDIPFPKPLAIIVKGNPKYLVKMRSEAIGFYDRLKRLLEKKGFRVEFDQGKPYTQPKDAALWVGHSRGIDRLRFAPEKTERLELQTKSNKGLDPNHYRLSDVDLHNIKNIRINNNQVRIEKKIDTQIYDEDFVTADQVDVKFYHLSFDEDLPNKLSPQLPAGSGIQGDNVEPMIPRVSFSPTIEQCFRAIYPNISFYFEEKNYPHMDIWLYQAEPKSDTRVVVPQTLIDHKWVWDAHITDEYWILDSVKIKRIGQVRFFNPGNDDPNRMVHPFSDKTQDKQSIGPETVKFEIIKNQIEIDTKHVSDEIVKGKYPDYF